MFTLFQPDLAWWLYGVAAILLGKGLFETVSIWTAYRETRQDPSRHRRGERLNERGSPRASIEGRRALR
jgi:hypothetical protein